MRHAGSAPGPIGSLAIAMVEAALEALLVPLPGSPEAPDPARLAAPRGAVGVAPIARHADEEGPPAPAADPPPEDGFGA